MDDLDKLLMAYFDDGSAMKEKQGSSFYEEAVLHTTAVLTKAPAIRARKRKRPHPIVGYVVELIMECVHGLTNP